VSLDFEDVFNAWKLCKMLLFKKMSVFLDCIFLPDMIMLSVAF
jgi:hypothetical protein